MDMIFIYDNYDEYNYYDIYDNYDGCNNQVQWFTNFLIKNIKIVVLNLCQINNLQMNFINELLENLKDEKYIPFFGRS